MLPFWKERKRSTYLLVYNSKYIIYKANRLKTVMYFPDTWLYFLALEFLVLSLFNRNNSRKCYTELTTHVPPSLRHPIVIQGVFLYFVMILETPSLITVVILSFQPSLICGILFYLVCFMLNLISLTLRFAHVLICKICIRWWLQGLLFSTSILHLLLE